MLLGLDADESGAAVSNAALFLAVTPTAALRAHAALAPLHSGLAARAGYEAAVVARDGSAGPRILEGDASIPGTSAR
jgi:2-methylcitrate dehydratase PrpD